MRSWGGVRGGSREEEEDGGEIVVVVVWGFQMLVGQGRTVESECVCMCVLGSRGLRLLSFLRALPEVLAQDYRAKGEGVRELGIVYCGLIVVV